MAMNPREELAEFRARRQDALVRNRDYFIARQAFRHLYSWPVRWPAYKEKVMLPLVRKTVLTHANFLMGRGYTTGITPLGPNPPQRKDAQKAEKALFSIIDRCNGWRSIWRGAQLGSLLGTSGFKVYNKVCSDGKERAWFNPIQPEFLYPQAAGDDYTELTKVFYAYTVDIDVAKRQWGDLPYKTEMEVNQSERGEWVNRDDIARTNPAVRERRIPVLESWTDRDYMLMVGGLPLENDTNPYRCIPYVVIPNIDSGEGPEGLSDVDALVAVNGQTGLNNHLNWLLSDSYYVMRRMAEPTLVWEMPPPNVAAIIAETVGGGGVLPSRLGGKIYWLQWPGQAPDMAQLLDRMRAIGIEITGLNETAWSGQSQGSIQTGPSLEIKFTNLLATLAAKQRNWEVGIKQLNSKLLALGSDEGEIAVADDTYATRAKDRGMKLSGKDIGGHRETKIVWPGALPKDDVAAAQFELQKYGQPGNRAQSLVTTLENLGFDFPDDELDRIRQETQDEHLSPEVNANLMRARASQQQAQSKQDQVAQAAEGGAAGPEETGTPPDLNQLTNTPEGVGTLPGGQMVDDQGNPLNELEQRLALARANRIRQEMPLNMNEGSPV